MSEQAIKYLRENKDKYPAEVLEKTLLDAGYAPSDVAESKRAVYAPEPPFSPKPAVSAVKTITPVDQVGDILIGMLAIPFLVYVVASVFEIPLFLCLILGIFLLAYLRGQRPYIFYGALVPFIIALLNALD